MKFREGSGEKTPYRELNEVTKHASKRAYFPVHQNERLLTDSDDAALPISGTVGITILGRSLGNRVYGPRRG